MTAPETKPRHRADAQGLAPFVPPIPDPRDASEEIINIRAWGAAQRKDDRT